MPKWAGKWKGGRYYLDPAGRKVFFIERLRRSLKLNVHDEELAVGQLADFLDDPHRFTRKLLKEDLDGSDEPVFLTAQRLTLYLESIRKTVEDHRKARRAYLHAWAEKGLDLRAVTKNELRAALAEFDGGHRGRTEALNAFCRWLVKEGELTTWRPLVNHRDPEETRAPREAYSIEVLNKTWGRLKAGPIRDVFLLRCATGLHQTEIDQLEGARVFDDRPLPDKGTGIRILQEEHEIRGVLQVWHKSRIRHRASVSGPVLEAALRLQKTGVPYRVAVWKELDPITPSNLRHTFVTLAGEVGEKITFKAAGVSRAEIAQAVGHRQGSTMTSDRYDKLQIPPMIKIPLGFP